LKIKIRLLIGQKQDLSELAKERGVSIVRLIKMALVGSNPNIKLLPIEQVRFSQIDKAARGRLRDLLISKKLEPCDGILIETAISLSAISRAQTARSRAVTSKRGVKEICLNLDEGVVERLDREAKQHGVSRNAYATKIIMDKIESIKKVGGGQHDIQALKEIFEFLKK
jgi:predicted HicB family RNase H-like nuclease